jgi:hypothetical protein
MFYPSRIKYSYINHSITAKRLITGAIKPIIENGAFKHFTIEYFLLKLFWGVVVVIYAVSLTLTHGASGATHNLVEVGCGRKHRLHSAVFSRTGFAH